LKPTNAINNNHQKYNFKNDKFVAVNEGYNSNTAEWQITKVFWQKARKQVYVKLTRYSGQHAVSVTLPGCGIKTDSHHHY